MSKNHMTILGIHENFDKFQAINYKYNWMKQILYER